MEISQVAFGTLLVAALVGMAGYYGWRQVQALRALRAAQEPPEDRTYIRRQAWRRLVGSVLMVVFACLFAGWFAFGMDDLANQLVQQGEEAAAASDNPVMNAAQKQAFSLIGYYSIGTLLVFLMLVVTAGVDVLAIGRYRRRQFKKIQDDRRAMIERQAARLRSQRNGHG